MAISDKRGWYNGYSPQERAAKFWALKRLLRAGDVESAAGPCALCGDCDVTVEYHSEDYAAPFQWNPPAMYALCRSCHRDKVHRRFWRPGSWHAFIAHVRRGGYARDLNDGAIKAEVDGYRLALECGEQRALRPLRPYSAIPGQEWFAALRLDPESLDDPAARPR